MDPVLSTEFDLLVLFISSSLLEFQDLFLTLFLQYSMIDTFRQFCKESFHKSTLLMPPQGSILSLTHFLLYIHELPDIICNTAIYVDTTLYSKCDQTSNLWQQVELVPEL